nr:uncharacterized protein LOC114826246 [Malus domestica]
MKLPQYLLVTDAREMLHDACTTFSGVHYSNPSPKSLINLHLLTNIFGKLMPSVIAVEESRPGGVKNSWDNFTPLLEINKSQSKVNNEVEAEVEAARCAEREALVKLGIVMEEAEKSSNKVARVVEHKNQTEFKVLAISDKYLLWTADKKNLDDLLKVGEGLFKKPVCRVNLETGRVEPCKHESNEEALTRFARLLSEEKWLRLARSPVGHAANPN